MCFGKKACSIVENKSIFRTDVPSSQHSCEHDVVAQFAILEKYQRFWLDAPHRAIFGSGLSRSLRQREHRNGQPGWEPAWDCAPSMSASINWKRSSLKCIAN